MLPLIAAAAIPAIAGLAGGVISAYGQHSANQTNRDIAVKTNEMNRDIAREQMQFQERMSSTAWQRGMQDMRSAGINPILAATQGAASAPSGASIGAITGAPMQNVHSRSLEAVSSALQASQMYANLQKIQSDTALNKALVEAARADAALKTNSAKVADANATNIKLHTEGLKTESAIDETKYGQILRYLDRLPMPFTKKKK